MEISLPQYSPNGSISLPMVRRDGETGCMSSCESEVRKPIGLWLMYADISMRHVDNSLKQTTFLPIIFRNDSLIVDTNRSEVALRNGAASVLNNHCPFQRDTCFLTLGQLIVEMNCLIS